MSKIVIIYSGGLDSTVLCYLSKLIFDEVTLISFNYGQLHKTELDYAIGHAKKLGLKLDIVDASDIKPLLKGSCLTDKYSTSTVVPNRNAIMLSIAWGAAIACEADFVGTAVHGGDFEVYADCRPEFFLKLEQALSEGNKDAKKLPKFYTPFIYLSKSQIVKLGHRLCVPMSDTWSCYKGDSIHCGQCSTCIDRQLAFKEAKYDDLTLYKERYYE